MLRKILDRGLTLVEKVPFLKKLSPFVSAVDHFLYEPLIRTTSPPHIRDAVDLKRWMVLVVFALFPAMVWAIWNTGMQWFVYGSQDPEILAGYYLASKSFSGYFSFAFSNGYWLTILKHGLSAFLPVLFISYLVGGLWEGIFACIRKEEISEGFLVTGALYALILPSTIPYWMVALGVSFGVVIGKELFGGTGMNILNPALTCRVFLFFSFPSYMTGNVWVGKNTELINNSLRIINAKSDLPIIDAYSTASPLNSLNVSSDIKRAHVEAIAKGAYHKVIPSSDILTTKLENFNHAHSMQLSWDNLSTSDLQAFVTTPTIEHGLGLPLSEYTSACNLTKISYGIEPNTNWNFFFGNHIGSMGETSVLACLLGAIFLLYIGIASWRTMLAMGIGAYLCAAIFQVFALYTGSENGIWNVARYAFPAYKQLILGGLAFGLVFMATDPVSSPSMGTAKWLYGLLIGIIVIVIRLVNPGFPEGVMLAILFGNVFAPLFNHYALLFYRRRSVFKTT